MKSGHPCLELPQPSPPYANPTAVFICDSGIPEDRKKVHLDTKNDCQITRSLADPPLRRRAVSRGLDRVLLFAR